MEMSEHKVFKFYKNQTGTTSDIILKTSHYEDGSSKIEVFNLSNKLVLEATACCRNTGFDSDDAVIASDDYMPGLFRFLITHNVIKEQNEYINIGDRMFPVVKLLPEDQWITEVQDKKLFIINDFTVFAATPHDAFQLYLFAMQAERQTVEF